MNLEQMKARLGEILNELKPLREDMTQENVDKINELTAEANDLKSQIEAHMAIDDIENFATTSTRKTAVKPSTQTSNATTVNAGADRKFENGKFGFESEGDFFLEVKNYETTGSLHKNLEKIQNVQREAVGSEGGFLIPTDLVTDIQKVVEGDESLFSRARQFRPRGNRVVMNVNPFAPWQSNGSGNFRADWTGEGKQRQESDIKLKEFELKLDKLTVDVDVTEEMLEDAGMIESMIRQEVPGVIVAAMNDAFVSGDGVKKPTGILNSGFGFEVAKEAGQAANTILFQNLKKMYAHLLPQAKRNAIALYNVMCEEELIGMKLDAASTDGSSVYLPNNTIAGAPYGTLWGRPVMPMAGAMKALGQPGDIALVDFSNYYAAFKTNSVNQKMSIHAKWDRDLVSFKFTQRVAGGCPFVEPTETQYGNYKLSGFTYLQLRA